ncbi:MAG: hypothetical protein E7294_10005 [Lachnospiraceae bacterium]|nr:hypothetical protein [Lachnospiraceae bacterium]
MAKRNQQRNNTVLKYKKPLNLNIGIIIFATIFLYACVCVYIYATTKHIVGYEVTTGSLSVSNIYEGIALRQEQTVSSNSTGYINYFAREGSHVACGDMIYTVDQSGTIADMVDLGDENVMLSESDLSELRTDILDFDNAFDASDFSSAYQFSSFLEGATLKLANYNILSNMDNIQNSDSNVNFCYSPASGTVVYSVDGMEELTPEDISAESFEKQNYKKKALVSNELIGSNDVVYKLITSEDWSIIIPVSEERAAILADESYVEVKFLKNQDTSWAQVRILQQPDGAYALLTFNNSMSSYATDRFINIEILDNTEIGLKIPNSSIVNKDFYLIPKEYLVEKKGIQGFELERYKEDGTVSVEFVETKLYSESDTDYYVDTSAFDIGTYICNDKLDKYAISKMGSLIGVYNINKGYADFTEITILSENEEYSIVKSNTQYGLSEYDHIVLDAESVSADDFINQ